MSDTSTFDISLEQIDNYEFRVRFDDTPIPDLLTDEGSPLGRDAGPNPSRMLAVAVANCLSASLLFALRKYKNTPAPIKTKARCTLGRNEGGRLRVTHIAVSVQLADSDGVLEHIDRALAQFEDFCVVTESVRQGIAVDVHVLDVHGAIVHKAVNAK